MPQERYAKICEESFQGEPKWWWKHLWKLKCPTKKMTFHVMHFERKGPYLGSAQEETS